MKVRRLADVAAGQGEFLLSPPQRPPPFETSFVLVGDDHLALGPEQRAGLLVATEHGQRAGLAQPGVGADGPVACSAPSSAWSALRGWSWSSSTRAVSSASSRST